MTSILVSAADGCPLLVREWNTLMHMERTCSAPVNSKGEDAESSRVDCFRRVTYRKFSLQRITGPVGNLSLYVIVTSMFIK
jgi:hypothetical protein